jgi:polyphosphate glucokinase
MKIIDEEYVGADGLERLGKKKWRRHVWAVVEILRAALEPDTIVVGGGNSTRLREIPQGIRLGENGNAFIGGFRLWQEGGDTP